MARAKELREEADAIWAQAKDTSDPGLRERLKRRSSELHDRARDVENAESPGLGLDTD